MVSGVSVKAVVSGSWCEGKWDKYRPSIDLDSDPQSGAPGLAQHKDVSQAGKLPGQDWEDEGKDDDY